MNVIQKQDRECAYCGSQDQLTHDHVPPACLFPRPRPADLITVPCCEICQAKQSADDEYFKVIVASSADADLHPQAQRLWQEGSIQRSLARPEAAGFRQLIEQSLVPVDIVSENGVFLGRSLAYDYSENRLINVITRTAKGLFFDITGRRLSDEFTVRVRFHPNLDLLPDRAKAFLTEVPWTTIGSGVFSFKVRLFQDNPNGVVFLFAFYDSWPVLCMSYPRERLSSEPL